MPSKWSIHISMFIVMSFEMKVSRCVSFCEPSSVSCTMPITGPLLFGEMMFLCTIISCVTSARACTVYASNPPAGLT